MAIQTFTLPISSIDYHVEVQTPPGPPKGTILLVHAVMANSEMYTSTIATLLAAGYATISFDHVGHGQTPFPTLADKSFKLSMDDLTHHMHQIFTQASLRLGPSNLDSSVKGLIGCSIGGVLALRYAMLYPGVMSHVLSLCAPGLRPPATASRLWAERRGLFDTDAEELCRKTVERWIPVVQRDRDEKARERALGMVRRCGREGYGVLAEANCGYDYVGEEGRVRGKVVVVAGRLDGACDVKTLEGIAERCRGEFVVMEDTGHLPPLQREGEFEDAMLKFLERS